MNEKNIYISREKSHVTSGRVGIFSDTVLRVENQIDLQCFREHDVYMAREIALIIAEVFLLDDEAKIRIGGNTLSAYIVKEVYQKIAHEHVELVIISFEKIKYEIRHKKSYIRTALYNSVFEYEMSVVNAVGRILG